MPEKQSDLNSKGMEKNPVIDTADSGGVSPDTGAENMAGKTADFAGDDDLEAFFAGLDSDTVLEDGVPVAPSGKIAELEAGLADLQAQLAESRDQLLRKTAEFDNSRKRLNQEKQNAIEFANKSLLLDIIPIIDDFFRAILSAEASEELLALPAGKSLLEGIIMIEKRLLSQLDSKWGLTRFDSAGELFDPNRHEAVLMDKSSDIEEPVVTEEFLKGYLLRDRVIRAAQVKVLMPENEGSGE